MSKMIEFAAIAIAYFITRAFKITSDVVRVGLFWAAFVLTRPFGATFGDVLARPTHEGGLGFGPGGSSAVSGGAILPGTRARWRSPSSS